MLIADVREEAEAGDLGEGDEDFLSVHADAQVAGFDEIQILGGAGIVGIMDICFGQDEVGIGHLMKGADIDERALGIESDDLPEEFLKRVGDGRWGHA